MLCRYAGERLSMAALADGLTLRVVIRKNTKILQAAVLRTAEGA